MTHHYAGDDLIVRKIEVGSMENNVYVLECPTTHESLIVDCCFEPEKIVEATDGTKVVAIVQTHGHGDHVQALPDVKATLKVPVSAHPGDVYPVEIDRPLDDGDVIRFGEREATVLHTPGHTPGGICLSVGKHLVSGDTLFPGGAGQHVGRQGRVQADHRLDREEALRAARRDCRLSGSRARYDHRSREAVPRRMDRARLVI